jgi:hypothetical protein
MFSVSWSFSAALKCLEKKNDDLPCSSPIGKAPGTTGIICLMSPLNTIRAPPNRRGFFLRSFSNLSMHSISLLWSIPTSSMINTSVLATVSPRKLLADISEVFHPFTIRSSLSTGIPNREWAVVPPLSQVAALPVDAHALTEIPLALHISINTFIVWVFPVPPSPDRTKRFVARVRGFLRYSANLANNMSIFSRWPALHCS